MGRPIRSITIVGGGTAGWLTAAILNHRLQWGFAHPEGIQITLIESPDIPTIGVGEGTIPGIRQTLEMIEVSEAEFVTRTQATFKLGVQFDKWHRPDGSKPSEFFHPLTGGLHVGGRNPMASLLAYGLPDSSPVDSQLGDVIGHGVAAAAARKSPRRMSDAPYAGVLNYAYHVDAGLVANFLKEVSIARGVTYVRDNVLDVERDARGHIASLQLRAGGRHPIEFVVDCSGFRGLIIQQALAEPFISYEPYLFNDRAVAVQVEHRDPPDLYPATTATAMDAGWRWRIPLQSRVGTGYVFSSRFLDETAAVDELLAGVEGKPLMEPRILKIRVGRCRRAWVGNCVAIGLSAGFLEPLEATAIHFIDIACRRLLKCLPDSDFQPEPIAKFNTRMETVFDEVRDFLTLHFTLGDRDDTPYWRAMREEVKRSDQVEECLALWRRALPDAYDPRPSEVFSFWSVGCVLFGKGFYPEVPVGGSDLLPRPVWERYLREMVGLRAGVLAVLPDQTEILAAMARASVHGETAGSSPNRRGIPTRGSALGPSLQVMTPA